MYLSTLLINVGDNPDRPRPGRLWLRNRYRVHQRLAMAFPSNGRKECDREFLAPYDPKDFPEQRCMADSLCCLPEKPKTMADTDHLAQVHTPRSAGAGFLFRVDSLPGGRAMIVVLSYQEPDWVYGFGLVPGQVDSQTGSPIGNAGHLLAAWPEKPRTLKVSLILGEEFRFRLTANPTKKIGTISKSQRLETKQHGTKDIKRHGCRVPVRPEGFIQWLVDRSQAHGFRLVEPLDDNLHLVAGYVYFNKTHDSTKGQRLRSVNYEGLLEITDPVRFKEALRCGIGPAKAFGFGLLSVAPVHR